MNLKNQRRMAAEILKCGVGRVWIDPNGMESLEDAITRADIRIAIHNGTIRGSPSTGSRGGAPGTAGRSGRRDGAGARGAARGRRTRGTRGSGGGSA